MGTLWKDVRYGLRMLARNRGFTTVAVLTLALGIGANTVIFSFVNARLLKPLPFPDSGRLVRLWLLERQRNVTWNVSYPDYRDWRDQQRSFEEMAALSEGGFTLTGGQDPELLTGRVATTTVFRMLQVRLPAGRGFAPDEGKPGQDHVVVLSHALWQRRFAGDPGIVGRSIGLNYEPYTVIGVLPRDFRLGNMQHDLWVPLALDAPKMARGNRFLQIMGRLKPGVTLGAARQEMRTIGDRIAGQYPATNTRLSAEVETLADAFNRQARPALIVLMAAVGLVLLMACANVANLLLAKAAGRQKEIAIRASLGANAARIGRQMLTESTLVSMAGGVLGVLLSLWGVRALHAALPERMHSPEALTPDGTVLFFALALSLATGLAFGIMPALGVARSDLHATLKEGGRSQSAGLRHGRMRAALIVSEVALAIILLTGAGLLIKSFARLMAVDPGFSSENVLTMVVPLPRARYPEPRQWRVFFDEALRHVRALPGVSHAATTSLLPMAGSNTVWSFRIEGRPEPAPGQLPEAGYRLVSPEYFQAMRIPLRRGRHLSEQDGERAPLAVVINQAMADRFWPGEDPVGRKILASAGDAGTVVGVVGNVRFSGLDQQPQPEMFWSSRQRPRSGIMLAVRTHGDPASLTRPVREAIRAVDPDQPVARVRTLESLVSESVAPRRVTMLLLGVFALLALVLAGVGLYGVMSSLVAQRGHEIGIRMALGARRSQVVGLVVREAMGLTAIGVCLGVAGALALTRWLSALLFEVTARDPAVFVAVPVAVGLVALGSSFTPALRASRLDPLEALRCE